MSAPIGGKNLVDALLQRFRLLLFRDGAHDGFSHDIALAIHYIGGRIGARGWWRTCLPHCWSQNTHSDTLRPSSSAHPLHPRFPLSSPSKVEVLTPMSVPPFFASSLFSASSSASSPTQGLQVVNQKFTTVTALPENSLSLFTCVPVQVLARKGRELLHLALLGGHTHAAVPL